MKKLPALMLISILLLSLVYAQEGPKQYGTPLTLKKVTKVSEILANPEKYNGTRVLVEGPIVDVCPKRGCWIQIGSDKEFEKIQFKVDDGVIVFPMEAKGLKVRAEGIVFVSTRSKEQLIEEARHHAEEQGKLDEFNPESIKGPKTVIRLNGEGAVITK